MGTAASTPKEDQPNAKTMYTRRRAHYAGSWYDEDPAQLRATLEQHLAAAQQSFSAIPPVDPNAVSERDYAATAAALYQDIVGHQRRVRAVIVPHAGYAYSAATAAYSYRLLQQELVASSSPTTIVVLHPSHYQYLQGCAVSGAQEIETPLGTIPVDEELRSELLNSGQFTVMTQSVDEKEHSGEMQYPFLAHISPSQQVRILPIMCGSLSVEQETQYGKALSLILMNRPNVITVVSTDFCHWGSRFQYQPTPNNTDSISDYIRQLDHQGMDYIQLQQPGAFATYLRQTKNTICGRHAVAVYLRAVEYASAINYQIQFVHYAQSSAVQHRQDSSVSYAAAVATAP
jgi:MEMO1 family protein